MQKPTSITVIGILIIILSGFGALGTLSILSLMDDPQVAKAIEAGGMSLDTLIAVSLGNAAVMLISGIGILLGANWGRWLYVVLNVVSIIFGLLNNPTVLSVAPTVVIFAVFAFFLFQPAANAYFNRARS